MCDEKAAADADSVLTEYGIYLLRWIDRRRRKLFINTIKRSRVLGEYYIM